MIEVPVLVCITIVIVVSLSCIFFGPNGDSNFETFVKALQNGKTNRIKIQLDIEKEHTKQMEIKLEQLKIGFHE